MNTFPLNCGPEGAGDGRFYRTASGEWIPDGGNWIHGKNEWKTHSCHFQFLPESRSEINRKSTL